MQIFADSPADYINKIPEDRRVPMKKLRATIRKHLPKGFTETVIFGMIGYVVPHKIYPSGYHVDPKIPLPFICIASQKNYIALYHSGIYAHEELLNWFVEQYPQHSSRKLDMGKSCIRFKKPDEIPYDLIAQLVRRMDVDQWIDIYETNIKRS